MQCFVERSDSREIQEDDERLEQVLDHVLPLPLPLSLKERPRAVLYP